MNILTYISGVYLLEIGPQDTGKWSYFKIKMFAKRILLCKFNYMVNKNKWGKQTKKTTSDSGQPYKAHFSLCVPFTDRLLEENEV